MKKLRNSTSGLLFYELVQNIPNQIGPEFSSLCLSFSFTHYSTYEKFRTENVLEALQTIEINKLGAETHQPRLSSDSSQKQKAFQPNFPKNQNRQTNYRNFS